MTIIVRLRPTANVRRVARQLERLRLPEIVAVEAVTDEYRVEVYPLQTEEDYARHRGYGS